MKLSTETKIIIVWDRLTLWAGAVTIIAVCLVGVFASLVRWHSLDDWCANKLEDL